MAVVVQFDVTKAQADVDRLGVSILGLGTKAAEASASVKSNLDFSSGIAAEFAAIKKEMDSLRQTAKGLNDEMGLTAAGLKAFADKGTAVVTAMQASSKAVVANVQSLQQNNAAISTAIKNEELLSAAKAKSNIQWVTQEKVIRSTITAQELQRAVTSQLNDLEEKGAITTQMNMRYREQMRQTYLNTGTAAEKLLQTLKQEADLFQRSNEYVVRATAGYKLLTYQQQQSVQLFSNIGVAMKNTNDLFVKAETANEQYNRRLKDLNLLLDNGVITRAKYNTAVENSNRILNDSIAQQAKAAEAMRLKAYQDSEAAKQEKAVSDAIRNTTGVVQRGLDPLAQYTARLRDLNTARAGATDFSGNRVGLSQQQYITGLAGARAELERNIASSARAAVGLSGLTREFSVGTQAAAGFRAGLQGAGLGFGIFTGSTIAVATGVYALSKAMRESLGAGAEFQERFARAGAMLAGFRDALGTVSPQARLLNVEILGLAETTRFSASEIADAVKALGQAGYDTAQAMRALPTVLNLATVGEISTTEASERLVNILAAFGLQAENAAEVADKLGKASLVSTVTISQLGTALGYVGQSAHSAGISLETTLGGIAFLRQIGIQASKTGTDLRNIIQDLAAPTKRAAQALHEVGLESSQFFSGPGGALDLVQTFEKLRDKLKDFSLQAKEAFAVKIFDSRTAGAFLAFIDPEKLEIFKNYIAQIEKAQGEMQSLVDIINDNAVTAFAQFKNTLQNVAINAFTDYSGKLTGDLKELTQFIQDNGPKISEIISSVASKIVDVTEVIVRNFGLITSGLAAFTGLKIVEAIGSSLAARITTFMGAYQAAATRAAAAQVELNLTQNAGTVAGMRYTAEMEAEILAMNGVTAAAGRAAAATGALGVATGGAATAGVLSLSGVMRGGLALIGGWPTLIAAAVIGVGYFAYKTHEASKSIEVDLNKINMDFYQLQEAMKATDTLDFAGLRSFGQQVQGEIATLEDANKALQHNIDLIQAKGRVSQATYAKTGSTTPLSDADIAAIATARAQMEGVNKQIDLLREQGVKLKTEEWFKNAGTQKAIEGLQTLTTEAQQTILTLSPVMQSFANDIGGMFLRVGSVITGMFNTAGFQATSFFKLMQPFFEDRTGLGVNPTPAKPTEVPGGGSDAAAAQAARMKELANEIKGVVTEYEKATSSTYEFDHAFKNVTDSIDNLKNKHVADELAKIGVSAEEAKTALVWKGADVVFKDLKARLVEINPEFSKLKTVQADGAQQSSKAADAYSILADEMTRIGDVSPEVAAALKVMFDSVRDQVPDVLNGVADLQDRLNEISTGSSAKLDAVFRVDSMPSFLAQLDKANISISEWDKGAIAIDAANKLLGGSTKSVANALAEVSDNQAEANAMLAINNALHDAPQLRDATGRLNAYGLALQNVYNQTTQGALELQNKNLQNQIDLIKSGVNDLTLYNELWKASKGGVIELTDAQVGLIKTQEQLSVQLANLQAQQAAWKQLGEGMADVFAKAATGAYSSFKDAFADIKKSFKQLLYDLIKQAAMQQIMIYMGFQQGGGGGGGGGSWMSMLGSLFGSSTSGGSSGANSGWTLTDLAGMAASNNTGYNGGGAAGGGTGGGWFGTASNVYSAGRMGYNAYTGGIGNMTSGIGSMWSGSGQTMPGAGYFGSSVYGPGMATSYAPTALGYGTAVGAGLYMGYNRYQQGGAMGGMAGGATYAVGGTALALGAGSMMAGSGFAAGVGSMATGATAMGASAGVAAAIPIIGWIALAMMLVDMMSGGKLFGTDAVPKGFGTTIGVQQSGAVVTNELHSKGQHALFGGSYWENSPLDTTPEQQAMADKIQNSIEASGKKAASALGVTMAEMVSGAFTTEFDTKGNVESEVSTVLGKVYTESMEDFIKRMQAEQVVAQIGVSIAAMGGNADEASKIAEQFRSDATTFADAAAFMLNAQIDIKNGVGLLREVGPGVLSKTVDIVVELQQQNETLVDTYARLIGEVNLVQSIMDSLGDGFNKTGVELVQFSDDVVQALGGLDQAKVAWDFFTFGIMQGVDKVSQATSSGALTSQLVSLGLDANTSAEEFAKAFKTFSSSLSAEELAKWIQAGAAMGAISQSMLILQGYADGVDLTGVFSAQAQMIQQVNAQIDAAARLGASEEELAKMRDYGRQAIAKQLDDFMGNIESQIGKFEGGDWTYQLKQINTQMRANIDTARAMGASQQQLAEIQKLAAYQTAQVIAQLQAALISGIKQLHGVTDDQQNSGGGNSFDQVAADGRNALLDAQRELYDAAQTAIKNIKEFLDSLDVGALSPDGWDVQLGSAGSQFDQMLAAAQGGDVDAIQNITNYAQEYLQHAQDAYGNSVQYQAIFDYVTQALQSLSTDLGTITEPPDSSTGGGGGGGGGATRDILSTEDRFQLAFQIANQIGALSLATEVSIYDLMDKFGTSLGELATSMGINLNHLDEDTISSITMLAAALNLSAVDLLTALGAQPAAIGAFFEVTAQQLNEGNLAGLQTMAEALGISVFDAMTFLGASLPEAIKANGIDITSLDAVTMLKLGDISNILGVSIVELLTELGVDIGKFAQPLADTIRDDLSKIPNLSAETIAGLDPLLVALGTAITQGDLTTALDSINTFISTLPADQALALTQLFGALGISLTGVGTSVDAQTVVQNNIALNTGSTASNISTLNDNVMTYIKVPLDEIARNTRARPTSPTPGESDSTAFGFGTDDMGASRGSYEVPIPPPEDINARSSEGTSEAKDHAITATEEMHVTLREVKEELRVTREIVGAKLDRGNETQVETRDKVHKLNKTTQRQTISKSFKRK